MIDEPDYKMLEALAFAMAKSHFIHPAETEDPDQRRPRRFLKALQAEGYEITRKSSD